MPWLPLTFLAIAITTRFLLLFCKTKLKRFLGLFTAAVCMTVSLANAPAGFKTLVLFWLLAEPHL